MKQNEATSNVQKTDDADESTIDLLWIAGMLNEKRLIIIISIIVFLFYGTFKAMSISSVYRADAVVQIEQKKTVPGNNQLDNLLGGSTASSSTEIQIMKSRKVIGFMVDKLNLTTEAGAHYFPIIGRYIARLSGNKGQPAEAWMGQTKYAWGGETIKVDRFDIPSTYSEGPVTLVAQGENRYSIINRDGTTVLNGIVDHSAKDMDSGVEVFISRLAARKGTQFSLYKVNRDALIRSYQSRIKIIEQGKGTNILNVSLEGTDKERIKKVIDELLNGFLRQNVAQKSEESEKILKFIATQMPILKVELTAAEVAYNNYREDSGSIDLSYESQSLITRITELEGELSNFSIEKAELLYKLTPDHPVVKGIIEKMNNIERQKIELTAKLYTIPETELAAAKLTRDVKVATELYMLLLNRAQELKIVKAGAIGSARIIDVAVTHGGAVRPDRKRIILLYTLVGFLVGIAISALLIALNRTIDDPNIIENQLGYVVYAEIPFSEYQDSISRSEKKNDTIQNYGLLAHNKKDDQVVESLRSLRTSIQFALMEATNKFVMISGPSPSIGKSFISTNFAYLMADSGKKVLLIDADMRKGHIHEQFSVQKSPGLSEMLASENLLSEVINKSVLHNNLDLVTRGISPPNPSELLMSQAFKTFLNTLEKKYDLIIIDTPPILAVTDASVVGQIAATSFMVLRSGQHNMREIQTSFKRFEQSGININGIIFNGVELSKGRYGYGYKYYANHYEYRQT